MRRTDIEQTGLRDEMRQTESELRKRGTVRRVMEAAFRTYGLPLAIRTDHGPPFASPGLADLSRLSVWWIRLGITPERIDPGCPQQNGRHERFHLTLKNATAAAAHQPPCATAGFAGFQHEYNFEQPHEALSQQTSAVICRPSPRPFSVPTPGTGLSVPGLATLRQCCGPVQLEAPSDLSQRSARRTIRRLAPY